MSPLRGAVHPDAEPAPAADPLRLFDEQGRALGRIPGDERPAGAREDCGRSRHTTGLDEVATRAERDAEAQRVSAEAQALDAHLAEHLTAVATVPLPTETRTVAEVLTEQRDRDPGEAKRQPDWPEPPDYGRPLTATGQLLTRIDEEISGALMTRLKRVAEEKFARAEQARIAVERRAQLAEGEAASLRERLDEARLVCAAWIENAVREKALRQDAQARLVAVEGERDAALARIAELELVAKQLGRKLDAAERALEVFGQPDAHATKGGE